MRITLLGIVLSLLLGVSTPARADGPASAAEDAVLATVTAERAAASAPSLRRNADLDEAALLHAEDMASNGYVGHESPRTGDPSARVALVGFAFARVGENVARAASAEEAAESLRASEAHRAQIVDPEFTDVGVAVVEGEDGFYVVEVFAVAAGADADEGEAMDVAIEAELAPPANVVPSAREAQPSYPEYAQPSFPQAQPQYAQPSYPQAQPSYPQYAQPSYPQYAQPSYPQAQPQYAAPARPGQPQAFVGRGPQPAAAGAPPTVVLDYTPPANVQGYWVQHEGRWWFYAIPQGARAGTVLTPVPGGNGPGSVGTAPIPVAQGGRPAQPYVAPAPAPYVRPQPTYAAPRGPVRSFFRPSPRRHY